MNKSELMYVNFMAIFACSTKVILVLDGLTLHDIHVFI
jgi:hypothetical protein